MRQSSARKNRDTGCSSFLKDNLCKNRCDCICTDKKAESAGAAGSTSCLFLFPGCIYRRPFEFREPQPFRVSCVCPQAEAGGRSEASEKFSRGILIQKNEENVKNDFLFFYPSLKFFRKMVRYKCLLKFLSREQVLLPDAL